MPGMVRYIEALNPQQWSDFYNYLAVASSSSSQRVGFVETSNIRTMVTILHYIEGLVVLFDKDKNQKLSLNEVYGASPRFISFF